MALDVNLPHVLAANDRLSPKMCTPGADGVRLLWMEAVSDEVGGRFCRCLQAFVGDLSIIPQPVGWAFRRVS